MKYLLAPSLLLSVLFSFQAFSYSERALRSLRNWNQCLNCDLTGALLTRKDFLSELRYAQLVGSNLTGANLTRANLSYSNLAYVNLTDANLTGTNLRYTNLTEANLTGAIITDLKMEGAMFCQTIMPDGETNNSNCIE